MGNIAIYGFGRIGRSTLKATLTSGLFVPTVISDIKDISILEALFKIDTNYGSWHEEVKTTKEGFSVGGREIAYLDASKSLPDWASLGIETVIDCSGKSTVRSGAEAHLERGAKKVLVSAPSKAFYDCDAVLLPGINLHQFDPVKHCIISMASCTTNALAPVIKVMLEKYGIRKAIFSTVHAYTNSQSLTDQPMRDRRDSWAAAENIIPASSGAAKALQYIWPELKITGKAYRIPVRTGSLAEVNIIIEGKTTEETVRETFRHAASEPPLKNIMNVLEDEWASSRIVGETHSSIIDLPLTEVVDGDLVSIAAWYDNEMGYASRLAETAREITGKD